MSDLLERRHGIKRKGTGERRALFAKIDAKLLEQIDEIVPRNQRAKFVESVLRRELDQLESKG